MTNRPGRIFYSLEFAGVDETFIREYCQDNLRNTAHIDQVCAVAALFSTFNFDILKAMVEEMNRYDETPTEVLQFLNARPDFGEHETYSVQLTLDGKVLTRKENELNDKWSGCPMKETMTLYYRTKVVGEEGEEDYEYRDIEFTANDIEKLEARKGMYTFVKKDGTTKARLVLKRQKEFKLDFDAFCGGKMGPKRSSDQVSDSGAMIMEEDSE